MSVNKLKKNLCDYMYCNAYRGTLPFKNLYYWHAYMQILLQLTRTAFSNNDWNIQKNQASLFRIRTVFFCLDLKWTLGYNAHVIRLSTVEKCDLIFESWLKFIVGLLALEKKTQSHAFTNDTSMWMQK